MKSVQHKMSDQQIWYDFRNGCKIAFAQLYQLYAKDMFQFGFKLCSDTDVIKESIQELFIELWNNRQKLGEVEHIKSYLLKSFKYKLIRTIKNNKNIVSLQINNKELKQESIESLIIKEEINQSRTYLVRKSISLLPDRQIEALHLKYYQKLSNQQIAELMQIKVQSVANILQRAIYALRKKVEKKNVI